MEVEDLISIGIIKKAIGNNGSVSIIPDTDFPEHYKELSDIFIVFSDNTVRLKHIESCIFMKNSISIKFKNINTRAEAMNLKNARLMIAENELHALKDDEIYYFQLEGFLVITKDNEIIGKIDSIFPTNAYDILVVKNGNKEILIPFCDQFIQKILKHDKKIIINPIEGLLDAN
ncbi:MAG: 16S rRNA processing protein RimM [Candidatus Cloacimonetes bacterium]|nr:16S rRNA processing protein RimM [Candidatus Cloacimonadota bacterium]